MSSYAFSNDAIQDLDEICEYIAQRNPDAANRLFDAIRERCKLSYYAFKSNKLTGKMPIPQEADKNWLSN